MADFTGKTISHYKIIEQVGQGGMGVVYKAEDTKLKRTVALKFLPTELTRDPEAKERFIREAQTASSLQHDNICTIHEINETEDGQMFICMDYYKGETLKQKLNVGAKNSLPEAADIAIQIAQGLEKAHRKGIVHRDIKPANILLTNDGVVKILDFGLAKLRGRTKLTKKGTTLGTVTYMSPEQAQGKGIDHRTDIWSLGVVLYEMITGQLPFKGEYDQAVLYSILNEEAESITDLRWGVPRTLNRIVKKALAKRPEQRYQHINEMLVDLKNVKTSLTSKNRPRLADKLLQKPLKIFGIILGIFITVSLSIFLSQKLGLMKKPSSLLKLEPNSLAVMECENNIDPSDANRIGEMITDAVITDLAEFQSITVVSLQRLYDIMKQMGISEQKRITKWEQMEVAKRAGVSRILCTSISRLGNEHILNAQMIGVPSGKIRKSMEVRSSQQDIFNMVDSLTNQVTKNLGYKNDIISKENRSIKDVTTHSQEAYRYYLKGQELATKYHMLEALKAFKKAVSLDSTFATAYSRLAWVYKFLHREHEGQKTLAKAFKNIHHIKEREKFYVLLEKALSMRNKEEAKRILYRWIDRYPKDKLARYRLGCLYAFEFRMYDEAIDQYKLAIELDPEYREAYNRLGYAYAHKGMKKEAIDQLEKYVSLTPDEVNPYDSIGELYMNLIGDYNKAEEAFLKAFQIMPDFAPHKLAELYQLKGQYKKAEELILGSLTQKNLLPDGVKYFLLGKLYYEREEYEKAFKMVQKARILSPSYDKLYWLTGLIQLKRNNLKGAEANLTQLAKIDSGSTSYYHLLGNLYLVKGNYNSAIVALKKSIQKIGIMPTSYLEHREFYNQSLAEAYFKKGDQDVALDKCSNIIKNNPNWAVAYYLLGQIYEKKGWAKKAMKAYRMFLNKWEEADKDIPKVVRASQRIAILKRSR